MIYETGILDFKYDLFIYSSSFIAQATISFFIGGYKHELGLLAGLIY